MFGIKKIPRTKRSEPAAFLHPRCRKFASVCANVSSYFETFHHQAVVSEGRVIACIPLSVRSSLEEAGTPGSK